MTAGDTAYIVCAVTGGVGDTVGLLGTGSATPSCWFSGNLEV